MPKGVYTRKPGTNFARFKGHKHTEESKIRIGESTKRTLSIPEIRNKISINTKLGQTSEVRNKMSKSHLGSKNHNWKGGVTLITRGIRLSVEYKWWRKSVLARDNYTCIWCGSKEKLEVDHIKPFKLFPELRLAIDNGRTLCKKCHLTTDTYAKRK